MKSISDGSFHFIVVDFLTINIMHALNPRKFLKIQGKWNPDPGKPSLEVGKYALLPAIVSSVHPQLHPQ